MTIPNFIHHKITNEDGSPTPEHRLFLEQLTQALKTILSPEGIKTPQQSADNIALLNTQKAIGAIVYDSNNDVLKVNINGTFKTVQTS